MASVKHIQQIYSNYKAHLLKEDPNFSEGGMSNFQINQKHFITFILKHLKQHIILKHFKHYI